MKKQTLQIPEVASSDLPEINYVSGTMLYNSTDNLVQSISSGYAAIKLNADSSGYVNYGGIAVNSADSTLGSEDSLIQFQAVRNGSLVNWQAYAANTNTIYLGFTGTTYNLPGFATGKLLATDIDQNIVAASASTPYAINISGNAATATSAGPSGSAGGDLSGTYPNPTVAKINGASLGTATATSGNLLIGSGSAWVTNAMSGDITINSTGVTAIGASKVTNAMLAGSIADSKLSTISTAGKVSNSATTAASANTASAIVARDGSGNFSAGTITASLNGNATSATTSATATGLAISGTGNQSGSIRSTTTGGSGNVSLVLNRADVLSPSSIIYQTNSSNEYLAGSIAGSNYYIIQNGSGSSIFQLSPAGDVFIPSVAGAVTLTTSSGQLYGAIGTTGQPLRMTNGTYAEFGSLNLAAGSSVFTGVLPVANGGTGQSSYTDGQLLIGNTTGNTLAKATLTGTSNQVTVTNGAGSITLALPQSIATTSSPQFGGLSIISTGAVQPVIQSTTTGSTNNADLWLKRGDQTNGFTRVIYGTGASTLLWSAGIRSATSNYTLFDETNSLAKYTAVAGAAGAGSHSFDGSVAISSNGSTTNPGQMLGINGANVSSGSMYGIGIQKSGTDLLYLGINKNTATGAVPANAVYISSFATASKISIGRGDGTGSLSTSDILLNGDGTVTFGSHITAAGGNFTGLSVSTTGAVFGTIASTTTGSANEGGLNLVRGDQANGYAQTHYKTGAIDKWATGLRTGNDSYHIFDVPNTRDVVVIDTSANVSIAGGNLTIDTAGKTLKIKQGSNACAGTGATLSGGTITVNTTAVATGDIILLNCTAAGGTQTVYPRTSIVNNTSFTITAGNLDTSTFSWFILKAA